MFLIDFFTCFLVFLDVEDAVHQGHALDHDVEVILEALVDHEVDREVPDVVLENPQEALLVNQEAKVVVVQEIGRNHHQLGRVRLLEKKLRLGLYIRITVCIIHVTWMF